MNVKHFSSLKFYPIMMMLPSSDGCGDGSEGVTGAAGSGSELLSAGGFSQGLLGSGSLGSQPRQASLSEIKGALGLPRGPGSASL